MSDRKIIPQAYPLWLIRNDPGKIQKERFLIIGWESGTYWTPIVVRDGCATFWNTTDPDDESTYEVRP